MICFFQFFKTVYLITTYKILGNSYAYCNWQIKIQLRILQYQPT